MNKRIFVEKKADFQIKSESLVRELQHNLSLSTLKNIRIVQVMMSLIWQMTYLREQKNTFSLSR